MVKPKKYPSLCYMFMTSQLPEIPKADFLETKKSSVAKHFVKRSCSSFWLLGTKKRILDFWFCDSMEVSTLPHMTAFSNRLYLYNICVIATTVHQFIDVIAKFFLRASPKKVLSSVINLHI